MLNQEEALLYLKYLIQNKRGNKGIPYAVVGLGLGYAKHQNHDGDWESMPTEVHGLKGLLVHHEKMSIQRIRWHLNHYDELISGFRPMRLCVDGDKKFVFDGCHRTVALLIVGFDEFEFKVCRGGFDSSKRA